MNLGASPVAVTVTASQTVRQFGTDERTDGRAGGRAGGGGWPGRQRLSSDAIRAEQGRGTERRKTAHCMAKNSNCSAATPPSRMMCSCVQSVVCVRPVRSPASNGPVPARTLPIVLCARPYASLSHTHTLTNTPTHTHSLNLQLTRSDGCASPSTPFLSLCLSSALAALKNAFPLVRSRVTAGYARPPKISPLFFERGDRGATAQVEKEWEPKKSLLHIPNNSIVHGHPGLYS